MNIDFKNKNEWIVLFHKRVKGQVGQILGLLAIFAIELLHLFIKRFCSQSEFGDNSNIITFLFFLQKNYFFD